MVVQGDVWSVFKGYTLERQLETGPERERAQGLEWALHGQETQIQIPCPGKASQEVT